MTNDMTFPKARTLALQGYFFRRRSWDGAEDGHPLAWVSYNYGLYFYHLVTGVRIVEAEDVDADDLRATDWTIDPVDSGDDDATDPGTGAETGDPEYPPTYEPPTGNFSNPNGGRSGSSSGSGEGTGETPSSSGSGGSGSGGGSGAEGGGGDEPSRPPKQKRSAPSMMLTVSRLSGEDCVNDDETSDSFGASATLGDDPDGLPGEVWFLSIKHGSPTGTKTAFHGTITPGSAQEANFTLSAEVGRIFSVTARAYLSKVGLEASDSKSAPLRNKCPLCEGGQYFSIADQICKDIPDCEPGYYFNTYSENCEWVGYPDVYGCIDGAAINYNPSATIDDGSCIYACPEGEHWDSGTSSCQPDA